jgi:lysophospholipase L1-like esterase
MRLLSTVLLLCAALSASAALGQSLSIMKKAQTNYWVEASAPPDNPYALEASGNLHLWVGIQDQVQGQYSSQFDGAGVSQRYFRLTPSTPPAPPIRVMLIGDSMTADCCGWGAGIYGYFKPNATVVNYATAWASTKIFLKSAEMDKMLLIKPDYVLIQYGFMDLSWGADLAPDTYTTLQEFADNLRTIVQTVRGFNGVPILITLHAARLFDANGKVIPQWQDRNDVTKAVAAELQTPLIDLNQLTTDLFNQLGPTGTDFMHWAGGAPNDVMHLSPLGAQYVSQLVVNALPDGLGPYLIGIFDPPPKP